MAALPFLGAQPLRPKLIPQPLPSSARDPSSLIELVGYHRTANLSTTGQCINLVDVFCVAIQSQINDLGAFQQDGSSRVVTEFLSTAE